jgi:hypothetical protein
MLAMDGVRTVVYSNRASPALALNQLSAELARKHRLPFIDLHAVFRADWNANQRSFEFDSDAHWNEHGHPVAARAVARAMKEQP